MWLQLILGVVAVTVFVQPAISQDYLDAVFAGSTKSFKGYSDPVKFDREDVDVKGSFDLRSGKFFAFKEGIYFISMSGGLLTGIRSYCRLYKDNSLYVGNMHYCTSHNGNDTKSRDILVNLKYLESVRMLSLNYNSIAMFSDEGLQTSLSIFRLSDLMQTNISFSVTRNGAYNGSNGEIVPFNQILVNEGNAFDASSGTFLVPKTGYYFFSYSVGAYYAGEKLDTTLRRNAQVLGTLEKTSTLSYNCADTISRAGMYYLLKDDIIYISIISSSTAFSNVDRYISFSGFLYEPVHGNQRAWSVARRTSWAGTADLSPLTFDNVLVNKGGQWREPNNDYIAAVTGIYYITFTAGAQAGQPVQLDLMVGSSKKASITRTSTSHNGVEVLSRSIILKLNARNKVYLIARANTALHSTEERHVTFTGFLLFPHEA